MFGLFRWNVVHAKSLDLSAERYHARDEQPKENGAQDEKCEGYALGVDKYSGDWADPYIA